MTDEPPRRAFLRVVATAGLASSLLAGCAAPGRRSQPRPDDGSGGGDGMHSPGSGPGAGDGTSRHDGRHGSPMGPRTTTGRQGDGDSIDQWMGDVGNVSGVVDLTDRSAVTVQVGAQGNGGDYAFDPPAIRVAGGTTVTWVWTGNGGAHDVVARDRGFESDLTSNVDAAFRHAFDATGTFRYYCTPHRSLGMKGVVVVV